MLVVHAAWDVCGPEPLVLWAEPYPTPAADLARALAPCADALATAADVRACGDLAGAGAPGTAGATATLRLPARQGRPVASPERARTDGDGRGRARRGAATLKPFTVPAVRLQPSGAVDTLLALDDAAPVPVGASVRALARVAQLALEVVAGGRVAPSLERDDDVAIARWAPLRTGRDVERLALLESSMPGSACAANPRADARAVVGDAFDKFVDALCRDALATGRTEGATEGGHASPGQAAADAWLAALRAPDGRVAADAPSLAALEGLVAKWRAPLVSPSSSWRLCFRLHEPAVGRASDPPSSGWRIELLLQAVDEPTLLVEAAEVWRAGESLRRAARTVDHPQEVLLAELGRALRAFPELGEALAQPAPTSLALDVHDAHRFLVQVAPALEVAGFGVLLPAWWRQPSLRLGLRARGAAGSPGRAGGRAAGAQDLAAFDWEAALGDIRLDATELRRLADLKAPLVQVRGQWAALDPGEVRQLADFLAGGAARRPVGLVDLLRAAAGAPVPGAGVPLLDVEGDGPLCALLRGELPEALEAGPTPEGFCGELRPYQLRAVAWLRTLERCGLGACLADDMGLGKTATVLGLLQGERRDGAAGGPTLVVCPTSVVGNWSREVERFTPELRVLVHHGPGRARGPDLTREALAADVVVTSYPVVERDRAALVSVPWWRVVLDEAQQVKNPSARQTRAVRAIAAPRRIALSGTPVENHLGELWSLMEVLNPGLFGSQSEFRDRFAVPIERYGDEDAARRLRTMTRPFVLRRLKTDPSIVPDLPEKLETKERCTLTREQATLYQAVVDDMLAKIEKAEGIERRGLVLATMLRLKQVCNHPAQYAADGSVLAGRSGKLERAVEILEQVREAGQRALVFTQFAEMGAMLQRHLTERLGCPVGFLHGSVPRRQRDDLVAALQSDDGGMPVLVLSLKAGGTGLNLTAASHVLHYDRWWNPAVEDQATDRAFRIGQRRDVQVRKLVCAGTVEDRIDELIESKRSLADRVVGTGERWLTELSTDELAEVLALAEVDGR